MKASALTRLVAFGTVPAMITTLAVGLLAPPAAAATATGVVVGWGADWDGQATPPPGLGSVRSVAAGSRHSLAARTDGTVVGWGLNNMGQTSPPAGLTNVVSVAAGSGHSLALKDDGTVVAWGRNDEGQATPPVGLDHVTAIAAGGYQSLALKDDGTVVAWGEATWGATTPPAGLDHVIAIAVGWRHCLALKDDHTVVAWGSNLNGESSVPAGLAATAIAAGQFYSLAARTDGTVVAWGDTVYTHTPAGLDHVTAVAAGEEHGVALRDNGTVIAWSGHDTQHQTDVPTGLSGVSAIAAGGIHSLALTSSTVSFAAASASVAESAGTVSLPVTRTNTSIAASVSYRRVGGTASTSDVTVTPGTLSFTAGQASRTIPVRITNDALTEGPETVVVALTAGAGAVLGVRPSMTLTIQASDQRPDALISTRATYGYVGNNIYNTSGYRQARTLTARRGQYRDFYVRVYNDGNVRNALVLKGSAAAARSSVRYYAGALNVTAAMRSVAGLRVTLGAHAYKLIRVRITLASNAVIGTLRPATVSGTWRGDGTRVDVVKAIVKVVR